MVDMENPMHYKVCGRGEKVLLFLHGWGGNCDSFLPLINILKDTYRCVSVDFHGHGATRAERVYTLRDFTSGVREVLQKENITSCAVIAHSFGGRVALDMSDDPRVNALVIIDGAGLKPRLTLKKLARKADYKIKKLLKKDTSDCGSPDYRALTPIMKATFNNIVNTRQDDVLGQIITPTLLIWGKDDCDTPLWMAHKMHKGIKGSRLVVLEGGHFCYLDHAFEVSGYIRNFLNGVYYGVDGGGNMRHSRDGAYSSHAGVDSVCGIQNSVK